MIETRVSLQKILTLSLPIITTVNCKFYFYFCSLFINVAINAIDN